MPRRGDRPVVVHPGRGSVRFATIGSGRSASTSVSTTRRRGCCRAARDPFITVRGLEAFGHHVNVDPLPARAVLPVRRRDRTSCCSCRSARRRVAPARCSCSRAIACTTGGSRSRSASCTCCTRRRSGSCGSSSIPTPWRSDRCCSRTGLPASAVGDGSRVAALLAAMCKEDVALVLVVIGLLIAFRGDRRIGFGVSAGSLAWYVVATRVVIPWQNGIGPFYDSFFGTLGTTPSGVVYNVVRHPGAAWDVVRHRDRLEYLWHMLGPARLRSAALTVDARDRGPDARGRPAHVVPVRRATRTSTTRRWCSSVLMIATVEGVARLPHAQRSARARRRDPRLVGRRDALRGVRHRFRVSTTRAGGRCKPIRAKRSNEAAIRAVPANAAVSASYIYVPHLAHRVPGVRVPGSVAQHQLGCARRASRRSEPRRLDRRQPAVARRRRSERAAQLLRDEFRVRSDRDGRRRRPTRAPAATCRAGVASR